MSNASLPPSPPSDERTGWLVRHEPWLRTLARIEIDSRFQGKFSASDVVQQTMLEAWRGWSSFQGTSEAERAGWLRAILAHQLARLVRHFAGVQKRNIARERSIHDSLAQSSTRLEQLLPAAGKSPSGEAAAQEQQLALAQVLERLPDDYRQVIVLRNLQELPYEEIAQRMGRTPGAVRMLWVRALARLRDEIPGEG